jgi:hypothetical protein
MGYLHKIKMRDQPPSQATPRTTGFKLNLVLQVYTKSWDFRLSQLRLWKLLSSSDVMPWSLVDSYQSFGGTFSLPFQGSHEN